MKKVHRAVQTGQNKWEKRTGWRLEVDDLISLGILLIVAGYIVARAIIS